MASRICWHCEKDAHQTLRADPIVAKTANSAGQRRWFGFFQCNACGYASVGHALLGSTNAAAAASRLDAEDADLVWLPEHVLGRRFEDVPEHIAEAASEAYACYSIRSYRAAILMARSVVEAVAKDQGITKGQLADKIDALACRQLIRPLIQESAHEIRHLGNDMAHGDFVEPTAAEDAEDVLHFMSVVLQEVYQLPAQVNARKSTRAARNQAARERREAATQEQAS